MRFQGDETERYVNFVKFSKAIVDNYKKETSMTDIRDIIQTIGNIRFVHIDDYLGEVEKKPKNGNTPVLVFIVDKNKTYGHVAFE